MDLLLMICAIFAVPVVCFVFFFRGLKKIKNCKKEMKTNPDDKLKNEIKKQTVIMVVTGLIGTVTGAVSLYVFINLMLLLTGAIPAM